VAELQEIFDSALEHGAVDPALDAVLELEDLHEEWPPGEPARDAHRVLRGMVTRLGAALADAAGEEDSRARAIEALLAVRDRARAEGRWEDADAIRDALLLLSVAVRDTPRGTEWTTVSRP
jgi:cysteinyl-tRNA synthetase